MSNKNVWRYYEGTTSSNTFIKDLSKVLCTAVKTKELKNSDGAVLRKREVLINRNWDIVFPQPDKTSDELIDVMDWNNLTPDEFVRKINNQVSLADDTIILKTKTTPVKVDTDAVDDMGLENDLSKESIEMYLELYKPRYLADPETYHPECERQGIMPYLVTQDIYKDYAKGESENVINLKDATKGTDPTKNIIVTYSKDASSNTKRMDVDDDYAPFAKDMEKFGISLPTLTIAGTINTSKFEISNDKLKVILKSTGLAGEIISGLYNPKFVDKDYVVILQVTKSQSYSSRCDINLSWSRDRENIAIQKGYIFKVPYAEQARWDTITLSLDGDSGSSNDIMNNFIIDKVAGEIRCKETFSAYTDIQGDPILSYMYKKVDNMITTKNLLDNHHYIYVRVFDKLNAAGDGPLVQIRDERGSNDRGSGYANVSEWSKLSWYQDFSELAIDSLDSDPGINNMSDGVVYLPIDTPGLNGETRMRFWINCNNDRASLVIMGNPSLDFSENRHLISNAYIGRIESFEGSINDTAGNFALYTSSSSAPCSSKTETKKSYTEENSVIGVGDGQTVNFNIELPDKSYYNSDDVATIDLTTQEGGITTLKQGDGFNINVANDKKSAAIVLFTAPQTGVTVTLNFTSYSVKNITTRGIVRDNLGNIVSTVYPNTYGVNTATGVIDVAMLHTRSKAYFQKHHFMFTTTEEYMTKESYGKSAYTNEFFSDKIKITHGNDGPRGYLADMLAIDTSSLYAFDELIVNRGFNKSKSEQEETYVFFPITAPFSPFSGSPNGTYGVALKKDFKRPEPSSDEEAVDAAIEELELYVGNLKNLTNDIYLPDSMENGVTVSWTSDDEDLIRIQSVSALKKGRK